MADEPKPTAPVTKPTPEQRTAAIAAYYDAPTRAAKAEVVKQNPFLAQIFSAANHS